MTGASKATHRRHLSKKGSRSWAYVCAVALGAFFGSLFDILLFDRAYPLTIVGALILPVLVYLGGRAWAVQQAAAEHDAVQAEEAYRQKVVAERMARVAAEDGRTSTPGPRGPTP